MGFSLYDVDGWVGDLASIHDYADTLKFIDSFTAVDHLKGFINTGVTESMSEVIANIVMILPKATDEGVKLALQAMKKGLEKSKEMTIISQ